MKKNVVLILILSILLIVFIFGMFLGSFNFTNSKRLGKTNYYLVKGAANVVGLYYKYPEMSDMFVGVLEGHITDIYWNEQYILVTQCAINSDSIRGYYIIKMLPPVETGVPYEKISIFSKEEYEQKKKELRLNEKEMKHN